MWDQAVQNRKEEKKLVKQKQVEKLSKEVVIKDSGKNIKNKVVMKERYNQGKNVKGLEHNPYVIG